MNRYPMWKYALLHSWNSTQTEGWWRIAFDTYGLPYDYIGPEDIGKIADLRTKYDVIIAGPGLSQAVVDGQPMWRNPQPWRNSSETPNVATFAQTDDTRVGMQLEGLIHLRDFVNKGVYSPGGPCTGDDICTDRGEGLSDMDTDAGADPGHARGLAVEPELLQKVLRVQQRGLPFLQGAPLPLSHAGRDRDLK